MIRIVHNKLLGGHFVVAGKHQTPISGRFDTRAEAQAWLNHRNAYGEYYFYCGKKERARLDRFRKSEGK